jgi:hypothetical protein
MSASDQYYQYYPTNTEVKILKMPVGSSRLVFNLDRSLVEVAQRAVAGSYNHHFSVVPHPEGFELTRLETRDPDGPRGRWPTNTRGRPKTSPLWNLAPDETCTIANRTINKIRPHAFYIAKKTGWKFQCSETPDGVTVRRTA